MRFRSYPKIGTAVTGAPGGAWVATEKIHGANFVIAVERGDVVGGGDDVAGDGDAVVRFGKRKDWLAAEDAFFGWQLLVPELTAQARAIAAAAGAVQVVCYGELFGGGYPHPEVAALVGLTPVQTGVWYAPDLRWAVFDVLVATGDDDVGELLAHGDVEELAAGAGALTPPVLGRGRRDELDRIAVSAATGVPELLGLPPIAGNLREGFVCKPDRRLPADARPIVKRKLADFDDARFDGAEPWDPGHLGVAELAGWARRLVNPARVASASSKVGTVTATIVDEIVLDVAVDLESVFAASWRDLGPAGEAIVLAEVRAAALAATRR